MRSFAWHKLVSKYLPFIDGYRVVLLTKFSSKATSDAMYNQNQMIHILTLLKRMLVVEPQ
jgi:hypothetical protein